MDATVRDGGDFALGEPVPLPAGNLARLTADARATEGQGAYEPVIRYAWWLRSQR